MTGNCASIAPTDSFSTVTKGPHIAAERLKMTNMSNLELAEYDQQIVDAAANMTLNRALAIVYELAADNAEIDTDEPSLVETQLENNAALEKVWAFMMKLPENTAE